jgi:vancomycin resistance protein VanJ
VAWATGRLLPPTQAGAHMIRGVARFIALGYLAITAGLFALSLVVPETYRGLVRTFLSLALFGAFPVLVLCVLCRHRRLALLSVVPLVGLALVYGPYLLPRSGVASADSGQELVVLTFNLKGATRSLDVVEAIIREADADVVGLQELSREAAEYLERELSDLYAYSALYPQENSIRGQGVLSRLAIRDDMYWPNERRLLGNQRLELAMPETVIVFYNVHATPPFSFSWGVNAAAHDAALSEVIDRVQDETLPVIVVGDFNMTDQFPAYSRLTAELGLVDTFRAAGRPGFGFTFPSNLPVPPLLRLDYIFHDSRFATSDAHVYGRSGPADHLPVLARLWLTAQPD